MKQFFKLAAAAAFMATAIPVAAEVTCIAGVCPTATGTTVNSTTVPPQPTSWQATVKFNDGYISTGDVQGMGIGKAVETIATITEWNLLNSKGSVEVDPNCGPACGAQLLISDWDFRKLSEVSVIARSDGTGTATSPVMSRAGSYSTGNSAGFMGSSMFTGVPPLTTTDLPVPIGE